MAGKMRSPNYPAFSLLQAIEAAGKLWARERRTSVDHETAARALGFKSLSGQARGSIGALRQYGFLEKDEKGEIRLSDLAVRVLHGNDADREKGLRDAALNPQLFKELHQSHADASEDAIRSYLLTRKSFADDGARRAAKTFRATLALAKLGASGYNQDDHEDEPGDIMGNDSGQDTGGRSSASKPNDGSGVFSMTVPFAKGSISVQVRVTGDALKPAHLARVRKYLELAEEDWTDGSD